MDWRGRAGLLGLAVMVVSAGCGGTDGRTLAAGKAEAAHTAATDTTAPAVCTPLQTAAGSDKVSVVARWKPGDSRDFTISRQRKNSARPEFDDASYQTDVQVKVVGVTETGAAMEWRQSGKGLFQSSLSGAMGQQATRLLDRLEDFTVEYSLDENGQFEAVTNRDAIRAYVERMITWMKEVAGDGAERKIIDRVVEIMRPIMMADGFIDTAVAQPIITFHAPYGLTLSPAQGGELDDQFPNPFGGAPIPATSSFEVLTPQDPRGCLRLRMVIVAKPGALSAVTDSLAGATGLDAEAREKLRQSATEMTLHGEHRWVLDPSAGWPVRVESTKTTQDSDTTNTDVTVIEAK
jgi:hypothetical protein